VVVRWKFLRNYWKRLRQQWQLSASSKNDIEVGRSVFARLPDAGEMETISWKFRRKLIQPLFCLIVGEAWHS
jgi:hypothetical protein